jgi:hypothetical protein
VSDNGKTNIILIYHYLYWGAAFDVFSNFLISMHITNKSEIGCYVNRVDGCLKGAHKKFGAALTSSEIDHFLGKLSKKRKMVSRSSSAFNQDLSVF